MKILIAPSETKRNGGNLDHDFPRKRLFPKTMFSGLTEKDLKCKENRYREAKTINKNIDIGPYLPAIDRYDGVMFRHLAHDLFSEDEKIFFSEHISIFSVLYGFLTPTDHIANYKLPLGAGKTESYWKKHATGRLKELEADFYLDLLPLSLSNLIDWSKLDKLRVRIDFVSEIEPDLKLITHGVKVHRGKLIREIIQKGIQDPQNLPGFTLTENPKFIHKIIQI